ncbi:MAG: hypothetical protein AB7N65_03435 [Vicinamibacterales bacterium]
MTLIRLMGSLSSVVALVVALTAPAAAQGSGSMTSADVQRLESALADALRDLSSVGQRDLASQLESALEEAREDTTYLKVKMRKGESVPRSEYFDLRDRIDDIRARARGTAPAAAGTRDTKPSPPTRASTRGDVPVGTEFDVRLSSSLSSDTAQVEQRFEATTMVDLMEGDRVLVPAGSTMRGVISSVQKAGRLERKGSLTLAFDQITIGGRERPIRATVTQALESEGVRGEAAKIGTGAGVGAIIGGILGGFKGALAGILIGGGGTIAATEGKDVELPAGTVLRVRLDAPLDVR